MAEQEEKRIIVKVAYNYFQSGNWDRALAEYQKLISIDPMDFAVHNMLAEIFTRKGEKEEAVGEYLKAASLMRATNNLEKALLAYGRVLKLEPGHVEAREKIEEVVRTRLVEVDGYLTRGAYAHAQEMCERLAERLPDHPAVVEKLEDIARRQKAQPTPSLDRAIRRPATPEPPAPAREVPREDLIRNLMEMADKFEAKQAWDEAVEALITILRFQPDDEKIRQRLHSLYRKVTRHDKAAEVWARINAEDKKRLEHAKRVAKETKPAPSPAAGPGLDQLREQAEVKLRQAVSDRRERERSRSETGAAEPDEPSAPEGPGQAEQEINVLMTQAQLYLQQNLPLEAMRLCQRVLELEPQNKNVRTLLQQIFEKKKL
jgi:tetratricopeptide (TPR) repeat protein